MNVFKIIIMSSILCLFGLTLNAAAAQFDAPFVASQEKHADTWAKEDKVIIGQKLFRIGADCLDEGESINFKTETMRR